MAATKLVQAAKSGDYVGTLEALRDELADSISHCGSGRDVAALSKTLLAVMDRLREQRSDATARGRKDAEVTAFEVIAGKRTGRRKAAEG